jgi:hypothetical protein
MRVSICEWTTFPASFEEELVADNGTFGDSFPDSLWDLETGELARRAVESMGRL